MTASTKGPDTKYLCSICSKPYVKKGCLTNHMKNIHDIQDSPADFLDSTTYSELDQEETFIRTTAQMMTADAFYQGILGGEEDNVDASEESTTPPVTESNDPDQVDSVENETTTTKNAPSFVPLCPDANNYIVQKGKTLPASFLTTLLPPAGFLQELDKSLQERDNVDNLLERFEQEIRHFKCKDCNFTCSGMNNLESHNQDNHTRVSPDPDMPSLGNYLASLERKMDQCYNHMIKQSSLIEKLLTRHNSQPIEKAEEIIQYFKCDKCQFETDAISMLNSHKYEKHERDRQNYMHSRDERFKCDQCNQGFDSKIKFNEHKSTIHNEKTVECPMCDYRSNQEGEVTKHIENSHPENQFKCKECRYETNSTNKLESHMKARHKQPKPVKCPMCSYETSSGTELTKHVDEQHPEKYECDICKKKFHKCG